MQRESLLYNGPIFARNYEDDVMTANTPSAQPTQPRLTEFTGYEENTERLPYWARSTNPIVRRHLGMYWRTLPPDARPFVIITLVWTAIMVLGMLLPPVFGITMLTFLASIMVIPVAFVFYGHILLTVGINAARHMQTEMKNDTFQLLQSTPMTLPQIFLGKVAAALWLRMDDLVLIAQVSLALSPPLLFTTYSGVFGGGASLTLAPLVTLLAAIVVTLRVILEPIMIGVLGVFIGLVVPGSSRAVTTTVALGGFYFLLLNLVRQLPYVRGAELLDGSVMPPNLALIIVMDFIVPLAVPLLVIFGLLKLAERVVTRD